MLQVGLTGGLASGKTHIAKELEALGCHVIHMDALGHKVLEPGGEAHDAVLAAFGTVDRKSLAAKVFTDPAQLERLNSLVHPPIRARAKALRDSYARQDPDGIVVTEAAILIETGSYKDCDRLILAYCQPEQQIQRAMARDGLSREDAMNRIRRQMPLEDKRKYADFVIDTSGSKESTIQQTRAVYQALRTIKP